MKLIVVGLLSLVAVLSYPQTIGITAQEIPQGATYELGFSPGGSALVVVLRAIQSAKATLLVACYEFDSLPIAEAMIAAAIRGVQVSIVSDDTASQDSSSVIPALEKRGIMIRDSQYEIEHNRFMVIDGDSVEIGSFNDTAASDQRNADNVLCLLHVPNLAKQYADEWQRLWAESR